MKVDLSLLEIGDRYTRPQLAELWGYRGYQALAKGVVTPSGHNVILLFVTHIKQGFQTQFRDYISGDYLYWEGESRHGNDDRVARAHERGEEIHLFYRDIHHSAFQYRGPLELRRFIPHRDRPSEFTFRIVHDLGPADDVELHYEELDDLEATERDAVVRARIGQGEFRDGLLQLWDGCAVTGISEPAVLRASHIKPWRRSTNAERLNPFNGLLLVAQYDLLFDRGFITFRSDGTIVLSEVIIRLPTKLLGIVDSAKLRRVERDHVPYLEYHQDVLFVRRTIDD